MGILFKEEVVTEQEQDRMRALELAAIIRNGRSLTVGMLSAMLGTIALVHSSVSTNLLAVWTIVFLAYLVVRAKVASYYLVSQTHVSVQTMQQWRRVQYISTGTFGILLTSIAWVALPQMGFAAKIGITCFFIVVSHGAASHSYSFVGSLLMLNILLATPLGFGWWMVSPVDKLLALCMVVQPAINTFLASNRHNTFRATWELIVKNERLAAELADRNHELQELGKSRNRLFAVAGHDLRQPVYALGLTIEQLNEYDPPPVLRTHFDRLRESSYLVSEMLQDLMDISNLERKDYPVQVDVVPLGPLLEQLRLSQDAVARAKGLKLEIKGQAGALAVRSDANLLRRILMNLVSNAIKYTIQGKITIECTAAGDDVSIRVIDTGIGIPEHLLDDVFQDYVRVNGEQRKDDGVGLGLSVVRRAVDLLGHQLSVKSTVGTGSVFELRAVAAKAPETTERSAQGDQERGHAGLVLLVEDDEYVRQALSGLLVEWGYSPVTAPTALEVLAQLDPAATPSVIIADLQLSLNEDGFDSIALIRKRMGNMRLPALLLTGDVRPSLIPKAAEQGITVAHKPLPPPVLKQKIRSLIETAATVA